MALARIIEGKEVVVLSGKYKGKTGVVLKIIPEKDKAIVQGINVVTYHQKPNPNANIEGGIRKKEVPIAICKWARYDMSSGKRMKLGVRSWKDGKKVLFDKRSDKTLEEDK